MPGRPIKNNAEYFSHDADMRNDDKILALRNKFEHKGYSTWCMFLEILCNKDNFKIELKTDLQWELLSGDLRISASEIKEMLNFCVRIDLLQQKGSVFYCKKLIDRLNPLLHKREFMRKKYSESGISASEKEFLPSENTQSKVKESKVNIYNIKNRKKFKPIRDKNGVYTLADGTKAIMYFGRYVDPANKSELNISYYPELNNI